MAGARPSQFRKAGGGFLNGVDGVITGYRFTDEFNGEPFKGGKNPNTGKPRFHSLFFELSARLDGADEDITQNLFAGDFEAFEVAEDGLTITPNEDGYELGGNSPFARFAASMVEAGFPETLLSETEINYEPFIGTRVRFGQEVKTDKSGKPMKRKVTKGKFAGKEFDDTTTIVTQVYDLPGKAGKTAAKPTKGAKATQTVEETANDKAVETLIALASKTGSIKKAKLSVGVLTLLGTHPLREPVRKLLNNDEFLETEAGWSYDAKKEVITVEEADEDAA